MKAQGSDFKERASGNDAALSDADVQRKAAGMIAAFHYDASAQCKRQIEKILRSSHPFGAEVWQRILAAIEKTQSLPLGLLCEYHAPDNRKSAGE